MLRDDISKLRQNYNKSALLEETACQNAIEQFDQWFSQAAKAKIFEHNAVTLATCSNNVPDARVVLLKSFDEKGFVFFTNYNSAKGQELAANPKAAMVFLWKDMERQVRIRGDVSKLDQKLSKEYFESRPVESQCGAIASAQSEVIDSREELTTRYGKVLEDHKDKSPVMPDHWGGYVLEPVEIEFWQGREGRMHDRLLYKKKGKDWEIIRLQP